MMLLFSSGFLLLFLASKAWMNDDECIRPAAYLPGIDLSSNVDTRTVLSMVYMYLWLTTALRVIGVLCLRIVTLYSTAQFSHRCLDK